MSIQYSRTSKNSWTASTVIYGKMAVASARKRSNCERKILRTVQKMSRREEMR